MNENQQHAQLPEDERDRSRMKDDEFTTFSEGRLETLEALIEFYELSLREDRPM